MTKRPKKAPPRKNSRPQNSKNRAAASAPTTSPPPPTPMTRARVDDRISSSRDCGGELIEAGEYPVRAPDSRWLRPGIARRATRETDERGHRSRLDRLPNRFQRYDCRGRGTRLLSDSRHAGVLRSLF